MSKKSKANINASCDCSKSSIKYHIRLFFRPGGWYNEDKDVCEKCYKEKWMNWEGDPRFSSSKI
jgi:hypothetical protein